jgi:hypothetical protein
MKRLRLTGLTWRGSGLRHLTALALAAAASVSWSPLRASDPAPDAAAVAEFENQVRPLLSARCVRWHGVKKLESGLRLDGRAAAIRGGDSGPALVPGKPEESLIVKAVRHEGDLQMPPGARLPGAQVDALARWVARGAPWPEDTKTASTRRGGITAEDRSFWSLRPVPAGPPTPPAVKDRTWCRTPVDAWVLAALEAKGLRPVAPAGRRALIRRATFDLTGLPPTPAEVDDFVHDAAPDAFDRVVDRLLASPAYGERWGRHWLDVVRYADTAGDTADYPVREAYLYRDYVIDAFNRDTPYDRFVREQVAGDVLAADGPREEFARGVTATGFLAISRRFGFDLENYHHLTIQDTIDTLGQAVLGLTLGCTRCHDHKYDPVTAKDYYALYGIFESTRYAFPGSEQKPFLRAMAPTRPARESGPLRLAFARELAEAEAALRSHRGDPPPVQFSTLDDSDGDFELQAKASGGSLGELVPPWLFTGNPGVTTHAQSPYTNLTGRPGVSGVSFPAGAGDHAVYQALRPARSAAAGDYHLYVNLDFRVQTGSKGPGSYRFSLGRGSDRPAAVEVVIDGESLRAGGASDRTPTRRLVPGTWYNLRLALDLASKTYSGTVGVPGDLTEFSGKAFAAGWDGTIDHIQIDGRGPTPGARPALDLDNFGIGEQPIPPPAPPQKAVGTGTAKDARARYAALVERGPCAWAYGVSEGTPRDARVQKRGEPGRPGEVVPRRVLEVLGGDPVPPDSPGSGRRELANWLTRPENPLTARVMVNRVWALHFGEGLVATENDFGRRGQPPTHPGLLDDLARRFMDGGWSVKALHRLILLSSTYQLSGESDPRAEAADPGGRLLWRFPRRRLDAESIRDAILFVSGGLDRAPGGPHPFPPVGAKFTQHMPFSAVYGSDRRSVYLMQQRIKRHPYLSLFDGADPNASTAGRGITTVPTQALFFMNDPFVHAGSAGFARRLLAEACGDESRVALAYRMAFAREPAADETAASLAFLGRYRGGLHSAGVPAAEHDARCWSALARTLFGSNEFLFLD